MEVVEQEKMHTIPIQEIVSVLWNEPSTTLGLLLLRHPKEIRFTQLTEFWLIEAAQEKMYGL
jgi:hypothetical protein